MSTLDNILLTIMTFGILFIFFLAGEKFGRESAINQIATGQYSIQTNIQTNINVSTNYSIIKSQ